ncbi:hypothetical protein M901_0213, partial [Bacteriovorax sp. DB6_IX]
DTMANIYAIWKRPVSIVTVSEDKEMSYTYDGHSLTENK